MNSEWIRDYLNNEKSEEMGEVVVKLCDTILRMENYIYSLEDKLKKMNTHMSEKKAVLSAPNYIPTHTLSEWITYCPINSSHMENVFKNTVLEGFKQYILVCLEFSTTMLIPLTTLEGKPKRLFVFSSVTDDSDSEQEGDETSISNVHLKESVVISISKWKIMTEQQIHMFIEDIWRKMLEFYYTSPREPDADETQRDLNKKKLLSMRKILVEKHGKEVERFLMKHLKQKI